MTDYLKRTIGKVLAITLALMITMSFVPTNSLNSYAAVSNTKSKTIVKSANMIAGVKEHKAGNKIKSKEKEYKEGEAIVTYKTDAPLTKKKAKSLMSNEVKSLSAAKVDELYTFDEGDEDETTTNVAIVKDDNVSTEKLIKRLKEDKDILYAEPNYRIYALSESVPKTGKYSNYQWGLKDTGANGISAETGWSKWVTENKGDEVVVAVVDTGVDYNHNDLKNNMWHNPFNPKLKGEYGYDFCNDDDDPVDDNGHGTHCAGIIGACGNVNGVSPKLKIMACKILDEEGFGWGSEEIAAYSYINKALDKGVKVRAINNSYGGSDYSETMENLINIVGRKGAVTVCAAGNDGVDVDEYYESNVEDRDFPACYDSSYKINVAATKYNGSLVSFSNYGENTVDLAAPGADILSTVSYDCYLPSIYDSEERANNNAQFYDFDNTTFETFKTQSGFKIDENPSYSTRATIDTSTGNSFWPKDSNSGSLKLVYNYIGEGSTDEGEVVEDVDEGDSEEDTKSELVIARIPYTAKVDKNGNYQALSAMIKTDGTDPFWIFGGNAFLMASVPRGATPKDEDELAALDNFATGYYTASKEDYWDHLFVNEIPLDATGEEGNDIKDGEERDLLFVYSPMNEATTTIWIDDLGISKSTDSADFGKYDVYSGTSMAAPVITGAVAVASAITPKNEYDVSEVIYDIISSVNKKDQFNKKLNTEGAFDFNKWHGELALRLSLPKVNWAKKEINLDGIGIKKCDDIDLAMKYSDVDGEYQSISADKITKYNNKLIIKNDGWINNVVDIKIKGKQGEKTVEKILKNIYLVSGKNNFKLDKNWEFAPMEAVTTDGAKLYFTASDEDLIYKVNPAAREPYEDEVGEITWKNMKALFKLATKQSPIGLYDFRFGDDLVYCNGMLYNCAEFSEVGAETDDEFNFYPAESQSETKSVPPNGSLEAGSAYYSEFRIIAINASTGKVTGISNPPKTVTGDVDFSRLAEYTLAAYNGKLYVIGGYCYEKDNKHISKAVFIYDPVKKKWSRGSDLPESRARGNAVQSGNYLVYAGGYGDNVGTTVTTLVFNGKTWKTGKAIEPLTSSDVATRFKSSEVEPKESGDSETEGEITGEEFNYDVYDANIGIARGAVVYMGMPVKNYGDTFIYNIASDKYEGLKYNYYDHYSKLQSWGWGTRFITVGKTGFALENKEYYETLGYKASDLLSSTGFPKITAKANKGGTIKGANRYIAPGNKATVKITAKKGYRIVSYTVTGRKTVKLGKKTTSKSVSIGPMTSNKTITVKFAKKPKKK